MSEEATNPMRDAIQSAISENPVILFMKGNPDQPICGFSARTVAILKSVGTAVRRRRRPARSADPPGALSALELADDPPAVHRRRARRRLRHRHRDVRVRRTPGGARARERGAESGAARFRSPSRLRRCRSRTALVVEPDPRHCSWRFASRRDVVGARPDGAARGVRRSSSYSSAADVAEAIDRLSIRGAPLIGVAAAYGVALELARTPASDAGAGVRAPAGGAADRGQPRLRRRPRRAAVRPLAPDQRAEAALGEARAIHAEEEASSEAIAANGAELLAGAGAC